LKPEVSFDTNCTWSVCIKQTINHQKPRKDDGAMTTSRFGSVFIYLFMNGAYPATDLLETPEALQATIQREIRGKRKNERDEEESIYLQPKPKPAKKLN
jgi:hypothetical protein